MKVKNIIKHSSVEVNDNHDVIDENAVPANGSTIDKANRQPAFVFADEFLAKFGEFDAKPYYTDDIEDSELPEELLASEQGYSKYQGFGKREHYDWYKISDLGIIFGVWGCTYSYDVMFNDDQDTNVKGWRMTYDCCRDYIAQYNGTNESYFEDYKGGIVSIVCNETEEYVYIEDIKR